MTVHGKKGLDKVLPPKAAEVVAKAKHSPPPKKSEGLPAKTGPAYALAPSKPDDTSGRRVGSSKPYTIYAPSAEAGLMRSAMGRLDRVLESYEQLVKGLEVPGAFADDIRSPLILAAREVQGQLDSGNAHADAWFKDQPNEMKEAKDALQERSARFVALTRRVNATGFDPPIRLPLQVPPRH